MSLARIETYIAGRSPLHVWTPQLKILSLGLLMFAFAATRHLALVLPMVVTTAFLYWLSGLPLTFWLKRLRYPGLFILMVVLILPLTSGESILWRWGLLAIRQEGLMAAALVVSRFVCILTLGFILLGTTPFVTLLRSLRSLGLPALLVDMTLLAYRYLFETVDMLGTMQQSMRLRGFGHVPQSRHQSRQQPEQHSKRRSRRQSGRRLLAVRKADIQRLAGLLGTLLIRSYERAERIYTAMRLRGYGRLSRPPALPKSNTGSWSLTCVTAAIAIAFFAAEFIV